MLKNIIAPVQAWLLSQKRCVGCGTPLSRGQKSDLAGKSGQKQMTVTCKCKRVYIFDSEKKTYRRALVSEL